MKIYHLFQSRRHTTMLSPPLGQKHTLPRRNSYNHPQLEYPNKAMPHKHRRDRTKSDPSYYDLPPSKLAHALPVKKTPLASKNTLSKTTNSTRKRRQDDDTPRAFTRLLGIYRPPRSGLDNGFPPSKHRKTTTSTIPPPPTPTPTPAHPASASIPTLLSHEPLSSFSARVDAALPFNNLPKHRSDVKEVGKAYKSKTERKMQKMQKEWREEDRRLKERRVEEGKEGGGLVDESGVEEMGVEGMEGNGKLKKGKKRKRRRDLEEDPWAGVGSKRVEEAGAGAGLVGLHDVVQAPPRFTKTHRDAFGKGEGGLKKKVELSEARIGVVEGYRALMRERRGGNGDGKIGLGGLH